MWFGLLSNVGFAIAQTTDYQTEVSDDWQRSCFDRSPLPVSAMVEIEAGSHAKYEFNHKTNQIEQDIAKGKPRFINFLGYPTNYGFIEGTKSNPTLGGDGDALDALILGPARQSGEVVKAVVIGALLLTDNGETDDKYILSQEGNGPMQGLNSLQDLEHHYPGSLVILQTWFVNYKGRGVTRSNGVATGVEACMRIYESAQTR